MRVHLRLLSLYFNENSYIKDDEKLTVDVVSFPGKKKTTAEFLKKQMAHACQIISFRDPKLSRMQIMVKKRMILKDKIIGSAILSIDDFAKNQVESKEVPLKKQHDGSKKGNDLLEEVGTIYIQVHVNTDRSPPFKPFNQSELARSENENFTKISFGEKKIESSDSLNLFSTEPQRSRSLNSIDDNMNLFM